MTFYSKWHKTLDINVIIRRHYVSLVNHTRPKKSSSSGKSNLPRRMQWDWQNIFNFFRTEPTFILVILKRVWAMIVWLCMESYYFWHRPIFLSNFVSFFLVHCFAADCIVSFWFFYTELFFCSSNFYESYITDCCEVENFVIFELLLWIFHHET